ncbi:methyltransferase [Streptomyces sp. TRM49041]|uniref:methyltransferase n=1 Tax=Streptomyces sp. TRM49041 TaxID=2603216 RepID=UPI0011ED9C51|nr:methyltransferase [Streptomyces sp. TRM49041]
MTTARMRAAGCGSRFTPVAGSFFAPLPTGADVYTLVKVIHNWNDEQAAAILRRCAEAGREDTQGGGGDHLRGGPPASAVRRDPAAFPLPWCPRQDWRAGRRQTAVAPLPSLPGRPR